MTGSAFSIPFHKTLGRVTVWADGREIEEGEALPWWFVWQCPGDWELSLYFCLRSKAMSAVDLVPVEWFDPLLSRFSLRMLLLVFCCSSSSSLICWLGSYPVPSLQGMCECRLVIFPWLVFGFFVYSGVSWFCWFCYDYFGDFWHMLGSRWGRAELLVFISVSFLFFFQKVNAWKVSLPVLVLGIGMLYLW